MLYYDFDTIRKYIIVFSKIFTDIHVQRKNTDNTLLKDIKIPVIYASKQKAYYQLNSNLESTATKLPLISITMTNMQYDLERQKNSMYGHKFISKVDNRIKKFVENPVPYDFSFEVSIWTKRESDMHKILQQILPKFKPIMVKNVNILPEMNLSDETKIIYEGLSDESEREFNESPDTNKMCLYTLSFVLKGLLFDPIKERKVVKMIELYMDGIKKTTTNQYSHDDIINNKLISLTDYDEVLVKKLEVTASEDKELYNYFVDLTTEITMYGENLKILDNENNEYGFVYEYSNGEYYGYDNIVPETLSISKTGMICILIPELEANVTKKLNVINQKNANYEFANEVLNLYVDFNRSVLRDITIEGKTKNDYIYNKDSNLKVKTVNGDCKAFLNNSIESDNKLYKFGFSNLAFENGKYICGLHTENGNNYLYLKTDDELQRIHIHEVVNGVDTDLGSISCSSNIQTIIFDFSSGDILINVDGQTHTLTPNINLIIPFINWNGAVAASLDYILGYKK